MTLSELRDVTVIVLSHNRLDELQRNLPHLLARQEATGFELVVVDNASSDGSQEYLAELGSKPGSWPLIVQNDANLGVAGGRNSGLAVASREYVIVADDDTWLTEEHIAFLADFARSHTNVGAVFPRMVDALSGRELTNYGPARCEPGNFMGGCHLLRRTAISQVGLIDLQCHFGGEEFDYSVRLRNAGWRVVYLPEISVPHNGLKRAADVDQERRIQWAGNYVRILYKHFAFRQATLYSMRICLRHTFSGGRKHGWRFCYVLLRQCLSAARKGISSHTPVTAEVAAFYSNPGLLPDCGNVPLFAETVRRIRGKSKARHATPEHGDARDPSGVNT